MFVYFDTALRLVVWVSTVLSVGETKKTSVQVSQGKLGEYFCSPLFWFRVSWHNEPSASSLQRTELGCMLEGLGLLFLWGEKGWIQNYGPMKGMQWNILTFRVKVTFSEYRLLTSLRSTARALLKYWPWLINICFCHFSLGKILAFFPSPLQELNKDWKDRDVPRSIPHLVIALCLGKPDSAVNCRPSDAELITLNNAFPACEVCPLFLLAGAYSCLAVVTRKII